MKVVIITPFLNEEAAIDHLIKSMISQEVQPTRWVLVDDGSKDNSVNIINGYTKDYDWISLVKLDHKSQKRSIGAKIINAFNKGLETISVDDYDVIMKIDADLILPKNYISEITHQFTTNEKIGLCGGVCGF